MFKVGYPTLALDEMVNYAKKETDYQQNDQVAISVEHPGFFHTLQIGLCRTDTVVKLKDRVGAVLTSNEMLDIFECKFTVSVVHMPRGAGRSRILNLAKDLQTKQCIVETRNADNLCAPRAIVTGLTHFK